MERGICLEELLKKATDKLMKADYVIAVTLYEQSLKFIRFEEENFRPIPDNEVLAVRYARCLCYAMGKVYFRKVVDDLIQLVLDSGKKFPTLFYGLAKLFFNNGNYKQCESIIQNGLKVLDESEKDSFVTNWPGTLMEIPESHSDRLCEKLKQLHKECRLEQGYSSLDSAPTSQGDDLYESGDDSDDTVKQISDDNSSVETQVFQDIPANDNVERESKIDTDNIIVATKPANWWKVDVPEFVPRNHNVSKMNDSVDNKKASVNTPFHINCSSQTNHIKMVNKDNQTKIRTRDAQTQTYPKIEKKNKDELKKQQDSDAKEMSFLLDKNRELTLKVAQLQNENKKLAMESQQRVHAAEVLGAINIAKHEAQKEYLQDKLSVLERKVNENDSKARIYEVKFQVMHSLITSLHFSLCNLERSRIVSYKKKCNRMIIDLGNILPQLCPLSIPTQLDCNNCIAEWREELQITGQHEHMLEEYSQSASHNIRLGNFINIPDFPDLKTNENEPKNLLHQSFAPAINKLLFPNYALHKQIELKKRMPGPWQESRPAVNWQPQIEAAPNNHYNLLTGYPLLQLEVKKENHFEVSPVKLNVLEEDVDQSQLNNSSIIRNATEDLKVLTDEVNDPKDVETYDPQSSQIGSGDGAVNNNACSNKDSISFHIKSIREMSRPLLNKSPLADPMPQAVSDTASGVFSTKTNDNLSECEELDTCSVQSNQTVEKERLSDEEFERLPLCIRNKSTNFCRLFMYIRNRIAGWTDDEILTALKNVRRSKNKLSGLTKDAIVAEIKAELHQDDNVSQYLKMSEQNNANECIICYDAFTNEVPTVELSCKHTFHKECIRRWILGENPVCPICQVCILE